MTDDYHPTGGSSKNPNSIKNLKPFGSPGANPRSSESGNKPWSIRNSIRYLARQEIDMEDPKAFKNMLPKKPTVAQVIAANALAKASKADMRAVEYATEQIDGKLAQTNINADFAALQGMSDDELERIANGTDAADETGSFPTDPESAEGSEGEPAAENDGADPSPGPAGV